MPRRQDDLDLSLTGSQMNTARSTKSVNKRPSSSSGRPASARKSDGPASNRSTPRRRVNSIDNNISQRVTNATPNGASYHPGSPSTRGISEDFLSLFDGSGARPKVKEKTPIIKKPLQLSTTSPFPGSARSDDSPRSARSKRTNTTLSHSIFRPDSPTSTLDGGDSTVQNTPRSSRSVASRISASVTPSLDSSLLINELQYGDPPRTSGNLINNGDVMNNHAAQPSTPQTTHQMRASTSSQKDLNATNNMLPAESRHPAKLELKTMQNSYQNPTYNVNKTPVNEIYTVSQPVSKNQAEDYIRRVNMAASVIQHAFRRFARRKKAMRASEAAMKRILTQKKEEMARRQQETEKSAETREKERQRQREERAKQARKQAVEELNRRREEDKAKARQVAEAELEALKREGKVGPKKYVTKSVKQRTKEMKVSSPREPRVSPREPPVSPRAEKLEEDNVSTIQFPNDDQRISGPITPSQASTRTTLDDLMNTLKLLEEDERLPSPPPTHHAWSQQEDNGVKLTAENLERHGASREEQTKEKQITDSKLRNILSFLDEVETTDRLHEIDRASERQVEPLPDFEPLNLPAALTVPSAEELESMERASAAASEVTNTVLSQRLQLDEKTRTVQMLQKALNQQRELTVRHARETEKEMGKRLTVQKEEYEETIQRHLNFIDQLIDDKKNLTEKCDQLVTEMKRLESGSSGKITKMQEAHNRELAKLKDMITASEKIKRERWIEEKTKKIKDLTVKGLEPEIQRLIGKHKAELKKLKSIHEAELLQSDERAGQRYVAMTEELRDQLAKEKEAACQRERELAAQRYEKQLQAEEEAYQQARRRLYQEIQEEKERLAQQASRQRQEIDKVTLDQEQSHNRVLDNLRAEYDKAAQDKDSKHKAEIAELKERLIAEKDNWEQNYLKKSEAWLLAKERTLREEMRAERDKEIELVISRLEEDGVEAREECERAAENRIKRIRDKYEAEMDELEKSERQAMEKYNNMKAELMEAQGELARVKVNNKQKDQEVEDIKRLSEKLHRERDHVSDVVRQEFADKLVATEEESKRVKQEMAELKSRHKIEIERMKQEVEVVNKSKQEEMDAVHARVKQAIAKKEEIVNQVKEQYQAALKRADHLEGLLEQQRKQLLHKK